MIKFALPVLLNVISFTTELVIGTRPKLKLALEIFRLGAFIEIAPA